MAPALGVLGLLTAVLVLVLMLASQRHRRLTPRRPAYMRPGPNAHLHRLRAAGTFRGVSIEAHCAASSALAGCEFRFEDAPALPVSGCDSAVCKCTYIGLPERRMLINRRSGRDRRQSIRMESEERRRGRPRRDTDANAWASFSHL